jgi:hypothetical protein
MHPLIMHINISPCSLFIVATGNSNTIVLRTLNEERTSLRVHQFGNGRFRKFGHELLQFQASKGLVNTMGVTGYHNGKIQRLLVPKRGSK